MAKRKQAFAYDNYLKLRFTLIEVNGEVRSQCVSLISSQLPQEAKLLYIGTLCRNM